MNELLLLFSESLPELIAGLGVATILALIGAIYRMLAKRKDEVVQVEQMTPRDEDTSPGTAPPAGVAEITDVLDSLRSRLRDDFFVTGPMVGQFGRSGRRKVDRHYQHTEGELLKFKPAYYLTYWGWRATKNLLPNQVAEWSNITAEGIRNRFAGKRWIEYQFHDYSLGPMAQPKTIQTIRHTVRAAQILLLIEKEDKLVAQVAWDLITESPSLMTPGGGWCEYRHREETSSLIASKYIYHFLSTLRSKAKYQDVVGEFDRFSGKSTQLIESTEKYLRLKWENDKWVFGNLPWQVNAPSVFIEYAPFARNSVLVEEIYETLRSLVNPAGRLADPDIGNDYDAPEYVFGTRLAHALSSTKAALHLQDQRFHNLVRWLYDSYSGEQPLSTCDITFLSKVAEYLEQ